MRNVIRAKLILGVFSLVVGTAAFGCSGDGSTNSSGTNGSGGAAGSGGGSGTGGIGGTGGGTGGSAGQGGSGGTGGGSVCNAGETQPCYTGDPATKGIGECKDGTITCVNGQWDTTCVGEIIPSGVAEVCDGKDEDCNGQVDDNIPQVTCGKGACQVTVEGCLNGSVPECIPGTPSAGEACDGVDDNCDGTVDEGCKCIDGETQACYTGNSGTKGVGECKDGTQTCANGQWGACENEVLPGDESCDGKDNDCDGMTDENLGQTTCGAGQCVATVENCVNGQPQTCVPGTPSPEVCDGKDNDCNLLKDDGLGSISCGVGACKKTVEACLSGQTQTCTPGMATIEKCNGIDDDCDGTIDDGNPDGGGACTSTLPGLCAPGTFQCQNGMLTCVSNSGPGTELCDNKDNNCNGTIDEGNPGGNMPCQTGKAGICAAGTTACTNGSIVCNQTNQAAVEVCNGLDDNCNGATDEMNPGGGGACTVPGKQGLCAQGTLNCTGGSLVCTQTTFPSIEVCDGKDNDCNGTADDGNPGGGGACTVSGKLGECAKGQFQCTGGSLVCTQVNQVTTEICDGKDNDCNGTIDNGTTGVACTASALGECAKGTTACTNGIPSCAPAAPTTEVCDGKDNDCNGTVDNNTGGAACTVSGQLGECAKSTQVCSGGVLTCPKTVNATTETCDGKDNDCNGTVDNGTTGAACTANALGECAKGTTTCTGGVAGCAAGAATTEVCDNKDNNCNGTIDDGNPGGGAACTTGLQGICSAGTVTCQSGALSCKQNQQPVTEICSNSLDDDCNGTVNNGCVTTCAHDKCTTGVQLAAGCGGDACVNSICALDPYCCTTSGGTWDATCVQEVRTVCSSLLCAESAGTCAHTPCTAGPSITTPLVSGCDSAKGNCVSKVCAADSYCCSTDWDQTCVNEVAQYCSPFTCK